jgi:hypothetical protein
MSHRRLLPPFLPRSRRATIVTIPLPSSCCHPAPLCLRTGAPSPSHSFAFALTFAFAFIGALCEPLQVYFALAEIANTFLVMLSCIVTLRNTPQQPSDASWSISTSSLLQVSNPPPPQRHHHHPPPSPPRSLTPCRVSPAQGSLPSFVRGIILADPSVFTPESTSLSSLRCNAIFARDFLPVVLPVNALQPLQVHAHLCSLSSF